VFVYTVKAGELTNFPVLKVENGYTQNI